MNEHTKQNRIFWVANTLIALVMLTGATVAAALPSTVITDPSSGHVSRIVPDATCERCLPILHRYNRQADRYNDAVDKYEARKRAREALNPVWKTMSEAWNELLVEEEKLETQLGKITQLRKDLIHTKSALKYDFGEEHNLDFRHTDRANLERQLSETAKQIKKINSKLNPLQKRVKIFQPKYDRIERDYNRAVANERSAYSRMYSAYGTLRAVLAKLYKCDADYCNLFGMPSDPFFGIAPSRLMAIARREKGEPPKLELPKPHDLLATVSREKGVPPKLVLPEPHDLLATVSRDTLEPEDKFCLYGVSDLGTCLPKHDNWVCPYGTSGEGICLPGPDDKVCPYGVSDAGECTAGPDDKICPYGVSGAGECMDDPGTDKEDSTKKKDTSGGGGLADFFGKLFLPHGIEGVLTDPVDVDTPEDGSGYTVMIDGIEAELVLVTPRDGNDPFDPTDPLMGGDTAGGGTTGGSFDFSLLISPPGSWSSAGGCGVGSGDVSFTSPILTLNPFYATGASATFNVSGNVATSTSSNLTILGAPGHTCTVTPSDANTFVVRCTKGANSCSDTWTRQ